MAPIIYFYFNNIIDKKDKEERIKIMNNSIKDMLNEIWENQGAAYLDMDAYIIYDDTDLATEDGAWLITKVDSNEFNTKEEFISAVKSYM